MSSTETHRPVWAAIAYYGLCSSTLLIVNKLALHLLSAPVLLLSIQLWFTVAAVCALSFLKLIRIQPLQWSTAITFFPVVVSFLGTLFASAKVLQYSNVETFITFRSSTPLVLCLFDCMFLGRDVPSVRSIGCLLGLLLSSAGYAAVDRAFDARAYRWLAAWYVSFVAHEVVVKRLCDTTALDNWTRVVYTNAMAGSMLVLAAPFVPGEHAVAKATAWTHVSIAVWFSSCVVGLGVSHSAYVMRSACSATLSAMVGIICSAMTVTVNMLIWDNHASPVELFFLAIGLAAGAMYKQAPMRCQVKELDTTYLK
jgi:solute carrier family 35